MRDLNRITRRKVLAAGAGVAVAAGLPRPAGAQAAWPTRPIKMIVPFSPGASTDALARYVASGMSSRLGQSIVVENIAGASGIIGVTRVASQPADGYTLLFSTTPHVTAPLLVAATKKVAYDPEKGLAPIGLVGTGPLVLVVSPELKVSTLTEFIELLRANPGNISYGSAGLGTINHLSVELLALMANVKPLHVPYKGLGPAISDILGGTVKFMMGSFPSLLPHVNSGKLRALAVSSKQRSPALPDIPTVDESGLPGFEILTWWGMFAPPGLPASVTSRLNEELSAVLASPEATEMLARNGGVPRPGRPQEFADLLHNEVRVWSKVIQDAGLTAE